MEAKSDLQLQLLSGGEADVRLAKVGSLVADSGLDGVLVSDNVNLFYLTGRVFLGYIYIDADGRATTFVRRPTELRGGDIRFIRKPEEMDIGLAPDARVGFMTADAPYAIVERLRAALGVNAVADGSAVMRRARAVKTPGELEQITASGVRQTEVYRLIPHLYREGMTDLELQIEIERALRLHGCLGQFRVSGSEMEIFMGNVLTGDNADTPSPYDFAMGGAGTSPSLPVGADGSIIKPNKPVMVDMNGNFNGYMTDMTRCFAAGEPSAEAVRANELSCRICSEIADAMRPGVAARDLYELGARIAEEGGMADYFMGHRSHAGFVGHGVGITINELPVLAPRSRDIIAAGNVVALEPKFVIPGLGAVGIENTYAVQAEGPAKRLTTAAEEIVNLL